MLIPTLLILTTFAWEVIGGHDMFEEMAKRPEERFLEFNGVNHGYGEASRQFRDIQNINTREFRMNRERHRAPTNLWGYGYTLERDAIFKGELTCHRMIGSDEPMDIGTAWRESSDFKIRSIEVVDASTEESYPFIRQGDDFIAYNPNLRFTEHRKFIKIIIRHTGCVPLDNGCQAVTTYMSTYKYNPEQQHMFANMNLAAKYYVEDCSWFRKVFNFWPFN